MLSLSFILVFFGLVLIFAAFSMTLTISLVSLRRSLAKLANLQRNGFQ